MMSYAPGLELDRIEPLQRRRGLLGDGGSNRARRGATDVPRGALAGRSVLVIDDDQDTCAGFSDVLTDRGYQVDVACDGPEALELVHRKSFRLALIDLRLPRTTGVELFRQICLVRDGVAAFLVTAYASPDAVEGALAAGMRQVLTKPVDIPSLLMLLERELAAPEVN